MRRVESSPYSCLYSSNNSLHCGARFKRAGGDWERQKGNQLLENVARRLVLSKGGEGLTVLLLDFDHADPTRHAEIQIGTSSCASERATVCTVEVGFGRGEHHPALCDTCNCHSEREQNVKPAT
jgi:hypothetical protein